MSEIMSFEEFTDKVKDTLVSHLPPEFSGATVDIQRLTIKCQEDI